MGYIGYTTYERITMSEDERFMLQNVEAITENESSNIDGRWRTVGCGGPRFDQWEPFCCPSPYAVSCPNKGSCYEKQIKGCYDYPDHQKIVENPYL